MLLTSLQSIRIQEKNVHLLLTSIDQTNSSIHPHAPTKKKKKGRDDENPRINEIGKHSSETHTPIKAPSRRPSKYSPRVDSGARARVFGLTSKCWLSPSSAAFKVSAALEARNRDVNERDTLNEACAWARATSVPFAAYNLRLYSGAES